MKTLFFDCASGISGNMAMGALLELTGDEAYLRAELEKLSVDGYRLEITRTVKNGITGTYVNVLVDGRDEYGHVHTHEEHASGHDLHEEGDHEHHHHEESDHGHHHHHEEGDHEYHHHSHRNLHDVYEIIDKSLLDESTKDLSKRIFMRVAQAESMVHNRPIEEVHFHEVGAIDSIIDIVGCSILINRIKPDRIFCSVLNEGYGFIECAHGIMSVPVPATSEIFAAGKVAFRQIDIDTELVTPTGAAIVAELAESYGAMPEMTIEKIGWGAGTKELKIPNVLKVMLGESEDTCCEEREINPEEQIVVMETNLDDCSGEILGYTMEKLFAQGARDVFFTPIYMKKNRPAYRLTVACLPEDMQKLQKIIFRETTTIGIRFRYEKKTMLSRENVEIETKYGTVKGKRVKGSDMEFTYPEYESVKELAEKKQIPVKELYRQQ